MARVVLLTLISFWVAFGLTIGTITAKPSKKAKRFQPLAEYLERELQKKGINEKVKVKFARSIDQMTNMMKKGEIDLFFDSVYPVLKVCAKVECSDFIKRWKKGKEYYRSVIFTRSDSNIESLRDLKGKAIAMDEPFSTSGYFIPYVALKEAGLTLVKLETFEDKPPPDKVGYVFANDEENVLAFVFFKKTDAGAIDLDQFEEFTKPKREAFKKLFVSEPIPRQLGAFRKGLDKRIVAEIKDILFRAHLSPQGRQVLHKFDKTLKITPLKPSDKRFLEKLSRHVENVR